MSDQPRQGRPPAAPDAEEEVQDGLGHELAGPSTAEAAPGVAATVGGSLHQASLWGDAGRRLRRNPLFLISAFIVLLFCLMAAFPATVVKVASIVGSQQNADPTADSDPEIECDILRAAKAPSREHWFGFDIQGCDYFSRVIYGARVSIQIGILAVGLAVLIAILLGSVAGYYGGFGDTLITRLADIVFAIPFILGGIVLLAALGERGLLQVSLVLVLLGWPTIMRLLRATILSVKESDYVQAARSLGAGDFRILRTHILPNAIAPVLVYATIAVGITISAEAALSFLGVGLEVPAISWGLQIGDAQSRIELQFWLLAFPAAFLVLLVLSFILMGDALRDALDPKLQR